MEVHMSIEFAGAAKARELRTYFSRYGRVYVVVNATSDDVRVPAHLNGDPALRLVLNVRMPQQILIGDEALESDLTFSGTPFHCVIPMHAIWAVYEPEQQLENGIVWEEDVPETIRTMVKAVRSMRDDVEISGEHYKTEVTLADHHLAAADSAAPAESPDKENQGAEKERDGKRVSGKKFGHLRVVK